MDYSLFSLCANIFGFITGGISLLSLIAAVCRPHLPSNKIKTLEALLQETENIFREAVEAGLLVPDFVANTENNIVGLKEQTCALQARAYNATTLGKDYTEFLCGTSNAIGRTCQSVKQLRAEVISSSQERRHRLLQTISGQAQSPSIISTALHRPISAPSTDIVRPHSCPPALLAYQPNDIVLVNGGPLGQTAIDDGSDLDGFSSVNPFHGSL